MATEAATKADATEKKALGTEIFEAETPVAEDTPASGAAVDTAAKATAVEAAGAVETAATTTEAKAAAENTMEEEVTAPAMATAETVTTDATEKVASPASVRASEGEAKAKNATAGASAEVKAEEIHEAAAAVLTKTDGTTEAAVDEPHQLEALTQRFAGGLVERIMWDFGRGNGLEPSRLELKPDQGVRLKRNQCLVYPDSNSNASKTTGGLIYEIVEIDEMRSQVEMGNVVEISTREDTRPDVQATRFVPTRPGKSTHMQWQAIAFGQPQPLGNAEGGSLTAHHELLSFTALMVQRAEDGACQPFVCGGSVYHRGLGPCTLAAPVCSINKSSGTTWLLLLFNEKWPALFSLNPIEHVETFRESANEETLKKMQDAMLFLKVLPTPQTATRASSRAVESRQKLEAQARTEEERTAKRAAKAKAREEEEQKKQLKEELRKQAETEMQAAVAETTRATEAAEAAEAAKKTKAKAEEERLGRLASAKDKADAAARTKANAAATKAQVEETRVKNSVESERRQRAAARGEGQRSDSPKVDAAVETPRRVSRKPSNGTQQGVTQPADAPDATGRSAVDQQFADLRAETRAREVAAEDRLARVLEQFCVERKEAAASNAALRSQLAEERERHMRSNEQHLADVQSAIAMRTASPLKTSSASSPGKSSNARKQRTRTRSKKRGPVTPSSSRDHSPSAKRAARRQSPRLRNDTNSSPSSSFTSPSSSFTSPSSSVSSNSSCSPSPVAARMQKRKNQKKSRKAGTRFI